MVLVWCWCFLQSELFYISARLYQGVTRSTNTITLRHWVSVYQCSYASAPIHWFTHSLSMYRKCARFYLLCIVLNCCVLLSSSSKKKVHIPRAPRDNVNPRCSSKYFVNASARAIQFSICMRWLDTYLILSSGFVLLSLLLLLLVYAIHFVIVAHFCCFEPNRIKKDTIFFSAMVSIDPCVCCYESFYYLWDLSRDNIFIWFAKANKFDALFLVRSLAGWQPFFVCLHLFEFVMGDR